MNNYIVIASLSSGEFGQVLHVQNRFTNRFLAVKVERREIGLLEYEAKIYNYLAGIKNIPSIRSYKTDTTHNYLFMDLMDYNLSKWRLINRERQADILDYDYDYNISANYIIRDLINVLKTIHQRGIIHRDIKPENICFQDGITKLIDFGLAKMIKNQDQDVNSGQLTSIIGTPNYISLSVATLNQPTQQDELESLCYIYLYLVLDDNKFRDYCNEGDNIEKKQIDYISRFIDDTTILDKVTSHLDICRHNQSINRYERLLELYGK